MARRLPAGGGRERDCYRCVTPSGHGVVVVGVLACRTRGATSRRTLRGRFHPAPRRAFLIDGRGGDDIPLPGDRRGGALPDRR